MEKIALSGPLTAHLDSISRDGMDIFLLENAQVRACVLNATRLVNEMRANHRLGILESLALSYATMGAQLCTNHMKGEDRLSFSMECDGPLRGFSVECNANGQARGYLKVDHLELSQAVESFDLAPYIGKGHLVISKTLTGQSQPVSGTVDIVYQSIARDLSHYFLHSEQIRTAISLSVFFDTEGIIRGAGGIFLQALPGADDQLLEDLEDWLHQIPSLGKTLAEACPPSQIMHQQFKAFQPELVGSRDAEFYCPCHRDRFLAYLKTLAPHDREALREHNPEIVTVTCNNCATDYEFQHDELD